MAGHDYVLFRGTMLAFAWADWIKLSKQAKIQTGYLLNTSAVCYHYIGSGEMGLSTHCMGSRLV